MPFPETAKKLIQLLQILPSVGPRTAKRYILSLLKADETKLQELGEIIKNLKKQVNFCSLCFNLANSVMCSVCSNPNRDSSVICIVEKVTDLEALEETAIFNGLYHVLGESLKPNRIDGLPENLKIKELLQRIKKEGVKEIILATNPDTDGDFTALYLEKLLKKYPVKITRLGRGLATGAALEYADQSTLKEALIRRK